MEETSEVKPSVFSKDWGEREGKEIRGGVSLFKISYTEGKLQAILVNLLNFKDKNENQKSVVVGGYLGHNWCEKTEAKPKWSIAVLMGLSWL